ncbi:hypothetical protein [Antiquaquibacter soli]|uniref:GtrA family protein n=1 Tax=Antiquaquibacter soli TaxID=3064523 RepID=A0ABT9BUC5_9MICO|nr:hypothetical protein [Protaetiibacter sp. WY-16]MDO7883000.1 hypothetical protein [Protaetiibacter sp. WY-16]
MTDAEHVRPKAPLTQRVWLAVYWAAAVINTWLLVIGLASAAEFELPSLVAVALAFVSTLIGALFATFILRHGVTTTVFVRSTTTVRVIAVAWVLLELAIVSTGVLSVVTGIDTRDLDWSAGFAGAVGSISILAVLGPGYKEYREAVAP